MTPEEHWEHIERILACIDKRHESIAQIIESIRGLQWSCRYDELFAQNEVRLAQLMDTVRRLDKLENR